MKLPRLRPPRLQLSFPSFDWLTSLVDRTTVLYVAYTAVLFVICLLVTFPHDQLVRRVLSGVNRGPVNVEFNTVEFAWHRGFDLTGVRLVGNTGPGADGAERPLPYLECTHFYLRPAVGQLVRGNPYALVLRSDLYDGTADGLLDVRDSAVTGKLAWRDLNIAWYQPIAAWVEDGRLTGRVSGQLDFEARGANLGSGQGTGEITIDGGALAQAKINGVVVPDIALRQIRMKFKVGAGRFEVSEFSAMGDVAVQGSGQMVLRDPIAESALNLRVTVATTPTTSDALKGAIALIPRAQGGRPDAPITVSGTLARPRFR